MTGARAELLKNAFVENSGWFGVRCVFRFDCNPDPIYEERVTVWQASGPDEAIELAESEAADYVEGIGGEYLGLAQVYTMPADLVAGAEVFSLMRTSPLSSSTYLDTFFDTGTERQTLVEG